MIDKKLVKSGSVEKMGKSSTKKLQKKNINW